MKDKVNRTSLQDFLSLHFSCELTACSFDSDSVSDILNDRDVSTTLLRTIFGPVTEGDLWRRRYNFEIARLFKEKDIINYVKAKRIQWLGHLERMEENRGTKKIFKGQCQGKRKRECSVKRWFDEVEKDLETLKVRNWKQRARDRRLWRKIVSAAMAQYGL
ncbi:uncharacterized protein [Parasteatoda tepidariorum]|uniref:uncharacterized protein n=1 Tax=Parasteatoda tepidariorum TaxID=114398 RepID=UPI0039BD3F04